jgi:hypothetical protein
MLPAHEREVEEAHRHRQLLELAATDLDRLGDAGSVSARVHALA